MPFKVLRTKFTPFSIVHDGVQPLQVCVQLVGNDPQWRDSRSHLAGSLHLKR
jgi:hypothetical protein